MRRGEILGLQRQDIVLSESSVRIERAFVIAEDGTTQIGTPKTAAGNRTLYMPPFVSEEIRVHLQKFVHIAPSAWLFPNRIGNAPTNHRNLGRAWEKARKAAGRPDLTLHDLRHSGLTWAAQTGATVSELMRQAGHASPAAAIRYQHAEDERAKDIAKKLGQLHRFG
jgi:integrase